MFSTVIVYDENISLLALKKVSCLCLFGRIIGDSVRVEVEIF